MKRTDSSRTSNCSNSRSSSGCIAKRTWLRIWFQFYGLTRSGRPGLKRWSAQRSRERSTALPAPICLGRRFCIHSPISHGDEIGAGEVPLIRQWRRTRGSDRRRLMGHWRSRRSRGAFITRRATADHHRNGGDGQEDVSCCFHNRVRVERLNESAHRPGPSAWVKRKMHSPLSGTYQPENAQPGSCAPPGSAFVAFTIPLPPAPSGKSVRRSSTCLGTSPKGMNTSSRGWNPRVRREFPRPRRGRTK